MRLSIVNDELSTDLNSALELAAETQACRELELRRLGLDPLTAADPRWLELAVKAVQSRRLKVTALSAVWSDAALELPALAERLNAPLLSITLPDDDSDDVPGEFLALCKRAHLKKQGVALRNHPDSIAGTAVEALDLLDELDLPNLGLDWDPASALAAGDGTGLDDLERIAPRLKLLHLRDAVRRGMGADWVPLGRGVIPWEDILEQLYRLGYRGAVVLDLGLPNRIREARAALPLVARWIDASRLRREANDAGDENDDAKPPRFNKHRPRP